MARWTGDEEIGHVLAAGAAWRAQCFEADGSVLSDRALWTPENLESLHRLFAGNPIEGTDTSFVEKLRMQLNGAPPQLIQLAAEALWVILLFPHADGMQTATKRQKVINVWSWSGEAQPPNATYLSDGSLNGAGGTGPFYQTNIPSQFAWLLEVASRWKQQSAPPSIDGNTEDAAWRFAGWLDRVPGSDQWPLRHALLYFCFPDFFERNVSGNHRSDIFLGLRAKLPAAEQPRSDEPAGLELDQALLGIRRQMARLLGTEQIDFYRPPLRAMWWLDAREKRRKAVASTIGGVLANYNLELHQTGSKKRRLKDTRPVDTSAGFWSHPADATNKPLRWILQLDMTGEGVTAQLPSAHGANRIAFLNSGKGVSGAVFVRIIPAIKIGDDRFEFFETWEWLMMLCFLPALEAGSGAQLLENYDPERGSISYKGQPQPYVAAALLALNDADAEYVGDVGGVTRRISYAEATGALQALLQVQPVVHSQDTRAGHD